MKYIVAPTRRQALTAKSLLGACGVGCKIVTVSYPENVCGFPPDTEWLIVERKQMNKEVLRLLAPYGEQRSFRTLDSLAGIRR